MIRRISTKRKASSKTKAAKPSGNELDDLYHEFLKAFYGKADHRKAKRLSVPLRSALAADPEFAWSIRGEEVRSLLAELDGDFAVAARSREAEIRKILELHALSRGTCDWDYVQQQYDDSDVADRLDLLAILYDRQGDIERAIYTLMESRDYCASHGIEFDSQDVLQELEAALATPSVA